MRWKTLSKFIMITSYYISFATDAGNGPFEAFTATLETVIPGGCRAHITVG